MTPEPADSDWSRPGLIYGPLASRRLGRSLGINPLGARKLCTFDCAYCQCGTALPRVAARGLASVKAIAGALDERLRALAAAPDDLCIAGNGEPTLHPAFPAIVDAVLDARDRLAPRATVSVLSNATALGRPGVRGALGLVDLPILKLDTASTDAFAAVNRPHRAVSLARVIDDLAATPGCVIQCLLVAAPRDTASDEALRALGAAIRRIRPRLVQVHTVARAPADPAVRPVPRDRLAAAARFLARETGVTVRAY